MWAFTLPRFVLFLAALGTGAEGVVLGFGAPDALSLRETFDVVAAVYWITHRLILRSVSLPLSNLCSYPH